MSTKVEIKQEPYFLETDLGDGTFESNSLISDIFQCKNDMLKQDNEMDAKVEIKQEPCLLQMESTNEIEPKVIHDSDFQIKSEPDSFNSDIIFQSDYNIHGDDNEIEIKEEAVYLEVTAKLECELKEINLKDMDLHFNSEDKASKEYPELNGSSRLDMEAVWNHEFNIYEGLNKDWLKRRKDTNPCHENSNIATTQGRNTMMTFNVDDKASHKCKFCGKCFNFASSLKIHIGTHEGKSKHKRNVCDNNAYSSHLEKYGLIHKAKRLYECDKCDKSYFTALLLRAHNLFHKDNRAYKCTQCKKSFATEFDLKTHNLAHKFKKMYQCFWCEATFTKVSHSKTHSLLHKIEKFHKCAECGENFSKASDLKIHYLLHELNTNNNTNNRGEYFTKASDLDTYNLLHELNSYKCTRCGESFNRTSDLETHNLFHDINYLCAYCGKSFTKASDLETHNLLHEVNSYLCAQCGESFNKISDFETHNLFHEVNS